MRAYFRGVLGRRVALPLSASTEQKLYSSTRAFLLPPCFTIFLEAALSDLVREGRGVSVCGSHVCLLAFADDFYLCDSSLDSIRAMASELEGVHRTVGQAFKSEKSTWMPVG